jgi:DNA (cytosine-5)-methyltransferase 1
MDYSQKTCAELREICKGVSLTGYSKMKKDDLIQLLSTKVQDATVQDATVQDATVQNVPTKQTEIPTVRTISESSIKSCQRRIMLCEERSSSRVKSDNVRSDSPVATRPRVKMIDLFAGTGAFTYAFEQTGQVTSVFANDMVEWSKTMYDQNFTHPLNLANLNDVNVTDIPKHDILTGGFPCQPFSIAGKRAGFDDVRSNVFWKILEILDHHQPSCIVLENVKNLVTHDDGNTFTTIKQHLTDRGYHLRHKVLDTALVTGIPQHRERIYIVGVKSKEVYDQFSLDFDEKPMLPISAMLQTTPVPKKYYYTDQSSTWPLVSTAVTKENTVYQYRRVYVRENKSNMCPTLTANMGTGGHNVPLILDPAHRGIQHGIRKLTPRECFNFQGFPESYVLPPELSDCNLYKMAGNAVSVPVVQLIANRLVPLLSGASVDSVVASVVASVVDSVDSVARNV